jgi:oxalate decarboxylase/phosphoglucose isomerase-like protein (cupin superfamily)
LIGHGVALTIGFIEPCRINLPHTHPRATEINYILSGTFETGFFQENGARFIMNTLVAGQATVYPQGAIHFEQNLNCDSAMFVAAFNSDDPGVQTVANSFYGSLPADIVGANLGGLNITTIDSMQAMLPVNPTLGIQACRQKCRL